MGCSVSVDLPAPTMASEAKVLSTKKHRVVLLHLQPDNSAQSSDGSIRKPISQCSRKPHSPNSLIQRKSKLLILIYLILVFLPTVQTSGLQ